ncbi:hypothetical protein B0A48_09618 [Cryoendolithus antarcticus]|uniref:Major facilitator superfamily (MFS) profile domain-containing protein n=1 Tax=Cryoendolithus antarcticus TaxID=1507870 RepID=A0A1V8SZV3_9PEZI|nr:hypothetical protein B0A48_09618 [Cryoendolithus antarcticus]
MQSLLKYRRIQIAAKQRTAAPKETPPTRTSDENSDVVPLERTPNDAAATSIKEPKCNDGEKAEAIDYAVAFDGPHAPHNPMDWPLWKKFLIMASAEFHVSEEAEPLATVLFLVGFGVGAPFAGPLSETFGRTPVYIGTLALFCCWVLGAALSPTFGAQLVFKFLSGFFGSTAFTTAGGTLGDTFDHQMRGKIFPWFGAVALFGPMVAPVVGAYVGQSGMDWRWVEWITLCIAGGLLVAMILFLPETYAPVLLSWKAAVLRDATSDVRNQRPLEQAGESSLARKLGEALYRPLSMLITEPIVILLTAYLTFVYIVSFSFFTGAPFIFAGAYGFDQGSTYLMFISVVVGLWTCAFASPLDGLLIGREYKEALAAGKSHAEPKAMLWWAMIAAPLLPISLFWVAWSDFPGTSYWSPTIA